MENINEFTKYSKFSSPFVNLKVKLCGDLE